MTQAIDRSDPIRQDNLTRLSAGAVHGSREIRVILERLQREGVQLRRGLNRRILRETARIVELNSDGIRLKLDNFDERAAKDLILNFMLDGQPYRFLCELFERGPGATALASLPRVIFRAERRDRERNVAPAAADRPASVVLEDHAGCVYSGVVRDTTPGGLAIEMRADEATRLPQTVRVREVVGGFTEPKRVARVKHVTVLGTRSDFASVGLQFVGSGGLIDVEKTLGDEHKTFRLSPFRERLYAIGDIVQSVLRSRDSASRFASRVVDIVDERGDRIRAIIDSSGPTQNAPVIVIPPAWGRTKETLSPLALVLLETFHAANEPVVVVRFDGIRKRGESTNEAAVAGRGDDHLRFSFSQGVRDIESVLRFLENSAEFRTTKTVLVTFSASSIEGRRALRVCQQGSPVGWICVVGSADLQSMMRSISGGVDFVGGLDRGLSFGLQEILGVVVDIDLAGRDAIREGLAYLDDACADFEKIEVPITWFHGSFDAWMDLHRVRHALSFGRTDNRRVVEIPTGHQLRSSMEALRVFALIAEEASLMLLQRRLSPRLPRLLDVQARQRRERSRIQRGLSDHRTFWQRYLLGRESGVGIELMTRTSPHRELMKIQVDRLGLRPGCRVADIGCGAGAFLDHLSEVAAGRETIHVESLDFVLPALKRAASHRRPAQVRSRFIAVDLSSVARQNAVPLRSDSCDAVLASLVISYVKSPELLIAECARILRPGGRVVISTLKPDADVSRIFFTGLNELRSGEAKLGAGRDDKIDVDEAARGFLNDAAKLLDFEEAGEFQFWDAAALSRLLRSGGFRSVAVEPAFGTPPQAWVASAIKPGPR